MAGSDGRMMEPLASRGGAPPVDTGRRGDVSQIYSSAAAHGSLHAVVSARGQSPGQCPGSVEVIRVPALCFRTEPTPNFKAWLREDIIHPVGEKQKQG